MSSLRPSPAQIKLFALEYIKHFNASRAAVAIGYAETRAHKSGYEIMQMPEVQEAVREAIEERAQKAGLTAEKVLKSIQNTKKKAKKAEQYGAAIRADELLGKHIGMWPNRTEVTGKDGNAVEIKVIVEEYKEDEGQ